MFPTEERYATVYHRVAVYLGGHDVRINGLEFTIDGYSVRHLFNLEKRAEGGILCGKSACGHNYQWLAGRLLDIVATRR